MPLIVEDGTLPAGANSFASVADADAYHAARLTAAWTDELAEIQKEAALIRASDWLNRKVMWNGRKASRSQRMAWPRSGVVTQDGEIAPDEIPAEVVEACCELAGFFVEQDYLAPLDRGGDIASLSVDVISIAYNGTAPAETVFPPVRPARRARYRLHGQGRGHHGGGKRMSASLYASVGRTARQLINKFGKRMIYRQKKDGQVYNDQTMRYEPSIKDTPFKGIRKNAKIEENPELPIQLGDCIILAAASGLPVPAVPDQIIMDGETWSVVDSAPVAPGDTALVHNILIRRG
ncbi:MAG: DnaT-like ssDNA-binding protein [Bilophila wadsworthia]